MKKRIVFFVLSLFLLIFFACDLQLPTYIEVSKTQELEFRNVNYNLTEYITDLIDMIPLGELEVDLGDLQIYILKCINAAELTRLIYMKYEYELDIDQEFNFDQLLNDNLANILDIDALLDGELGNILNIDELLGDVLDEFVVALKQLEDAILGLAPPQSGLFITAVNTAYSSSYVTTQDFLDDLTINKFLALPTEVKTTMLGLTYTDFNTDLFELSYNYPYQYRYEFDYDLDESIDYDLADEDLNFDFDPDALLADYLEDITIPSGVNLPALDPTFYLSKTGIFNEFVIKIDGDPDKIGNATGINTASPYEYSGTALPAGGISLDLNNLPMLSVDVSKEIPLVFDLDFNLEIDLNINLDTPISSATIRQVITDMLVELVKEKAKDLANELINKQASKIFNDLLDDIFPVRTGKILIEAALWLPIKLEVDDGTEISIKDNFGFDLGEEIGNGVDLFGRDTPSAISLLEVIKSLEVVVDITGIPFEGANLVIDCKSSGVNITIPLSQSITIQLSEDDLAKVNEYFFLPDIKLVFVGSGGRIVIPESFSLNSFRLSASIAYSLDLS